MGPIWTLVDHPSTIELGGRGEIQLYGPVAQRSEQRTHNPSVPGSNPGRPTGGTWCPATRLLERPRIRTGGGPADAECGVGQKAEFPELLALNVSPVSVDTAAAAAGGKTTAKTRATASPGTSNTRRTRAAAATVVSATGSRLTSVPLLARGRRSETPSAAPAACRGSTRRYTWVRRRWDSPRCVHS